MPRRRSGFQKKINNVHWNGFVATSAAQSAGSAAATLFVAAHGTETILRMRGNSVTWVDSTSAPGIGARVGVGAILVPEGTGTTVLWSPITDPDAPWLYYSSFFVGYEEMVTDVVDVAGLSIFRDVIDVKAMRISRNTELQCVVENVTFGSAVSINNVVEGRLLSGI